MVPPIPPQKAAWYWAENTKPEEVDLDDVLTAYRMNMSFCNTCRRNIKGNPCCLSGLGEKPWLSNESSVDGSVLLKERDSHVGLKNLGATCYANAFLQVWFHMPEIRNAVLSWDVKSADADDSEMGDNVYSPIYEIISCLQEVFGLLYFSSRRYIDPTILLNCLLLDNTVQQDAQEFSKLFMSKLEKVQSHGKSIFHDFVGRYDYVTSCTQCGHQTRSRSEFYELDLNVVNNKKLSACLEEFLQQEMLDGDNQFFCSSCKMKQNATRCIELVDLPSTLNLQLLRFIYDKEKQSKRKVSSPLAFPYTLDMSPYVKYNCGSSSDVTLDSGCIYDLFAILIHSGQLASSGHYTAVIRDPKSGRTFQFNDEKVIKLEGDLLGCDLDNLIDQDCVGSGENKIKKAKSQNKDMSSSNAYMLVYRRRVSAEKACEEINFETLPESLKGKIMRHNKDLNHDLSEESLRQDMLCKKENNIKLLYTTVMSYEGCNATTKLERFEFVPTENLIRFLQVNDMEDKVKPDVSRVNIKDTDTNPGSNNDNGRGLGNVDTGFNEGRFFCKHKKIDPDEIVNLKLLPSNVVDIIADQLGLSVRFPCSKVLCKECVQKRCADINVKMALSEDNKKIVSLMKGKQNLPTSYLIGKDSWKSWRKKAERNLLLDSEDVTEAGNQSSELECDALQSFNTDLLCCHNLLHPNDQNWKVVPSEVWEILKKYFPSSPEFFHGTSCCTICEDTSHEEQKSHYESHQQAVLLKELLYDLYLNRKRPTLSTLRQRQAKLNGVQKQISQGHSDASAEVTSVNPSAILCEVVSCFGSVSNQVENKLEETDCLSKDHLRYHLVSTVFIERWKKCCKDASKHEMPTSVFNRLLCCYHGKLLFDPWDSEHSTETGRQFVLLWPDEWEVLKNRSLVDEEIYVEIAETKSTSSYLAVSMPELCVECLEEKRREELQSRYHYERAKIYVHRLDMFDCDSSANHQSVLSINNAYNNNNNNSNNSAFYNSRVDEQLVSCDKPKKRRSDEETQGPGEKCPRLECGAAVRRSSRRSKSRGEKEIIISSNMTLRQLNFEIYRVFQVYKTNQVLYMDGRELVGDDSTLEELCIPPEALIRLEVREDLDENFDIHAIGSNIEEGFKGTGLVG